MLNRIGNFFGRKPDSKTGPLIAEAPTTISVLRKENGPRNPTFSKVFRWRLPDGQTAIPRTVEVVGTFTQWKPVPLSRDSALDAWHVTFHHIQSHRTHHYMLLVDGRPVYDRHCDGVAVPRGPEEERFQVQTDKGPRVFMLFAQTK